MADPDTTQWNGYTSTANCLLFDSSLSDSACRLYQMITCLSRQRGYCWATEPTLAGYLGCSARQVRRYLDQLEQRDLLRVERGGVAGISGNRYWPVDPANRTPMSASPEGEADTHVRIAGEKRTNHTGEADTHVRSKRTPMSYNEIRNMNIKDKDGSIHLSLQEIPIPTTTPPPPLRQSAWIAQTVFDYSRQLNDPHDAANIAQALRLWSSSALTEDAFIAELHTAYKATQGQARLQNKGAYFFECLRAAVQPKGAAA